MKRSVQRAHPSEKLVEAELTRRSGRAVAAVEPGAPADEQAIAALAEVRASIAELDQIAGRLARSAIDHRGSCHPLQARCDSRKHQARAAYGEASA